MLAQALRHSHPNRIYEVLKSLHLKNLKKINVFIKAVYASEARRNGRVQ